MAITTRTQKGSALTHAELDQNFIDLRDGKNLMIPKDMNSGMKVDSEGTPTYGWHDLHSTIHTDPGSPLAPTFETYRGQIKGRSFDLNDEAFVEFHIPHDYVMGSNIFIHAHWSHNSTLVTGGSVTWGFELVYAKGHNQAAFGNPVIVTVADYASTTQYQHMVAEVMFTSPTGSAVSLPVNDIEIDGVIMCRFFLDSNDMTVSGGGVPNPFVHFVDLHYQSTNAPTKNRAPNFWG